MSSFFWHDYETFGINPRLDRPAQFAGVRTDMALNPIGEPLSIYCQPTDDFLPDPQSVLITGITPQMAAQRGLPEHEFVARIQAELVAAGTCGVGYNTIRFDDELTRHLLWRNLYDPYAREWQNNCSRWDLLDCVRATYAFRPATLTWPWRKNDETGADEVGTPSFRLEHLTAANGIAHASAHDALSDVQATIALARLIRQKAPKLYEFCFALRSKHAVRAQVEEAAQNSGLFWHVSGMYPAQQGCMAPVAVLGQHPTNQNEVVVWDCQHDPSELFTLTPEQIRARLFVKTADLPADVARLPIKTIHLNRSPIVVANLRTLSASRAGELGLNVVQAQTNAAQLAALLVRHAKAWRTTLKQIYTPPDAADETTTKIMRDVDHALYDGFVGNNDRRLLDNLRGLSPEKLTGSAVSFDDARLPELLFRYRARNWPDSLTAAEREHWQIHRTERLIHGRDGTLSLAQWQAQLAQARIEHANDSAKLALLDNLAQFAQQQCAGLAPVVEFAGLE